MTDTELLKEITKVADLNKTDTVLEIGAGTGNLTFYIQKIAKEVTVIEKDKKLIEILSEEFSHAKNLTIINADAVAAEFPKFNKCVSNLPYTICEPLMWKFTRYKFERLVFVLPKGFAELLLGKKPSRLKLLVDAFYEVEYIQDVLPSSFEPQPKVMSALIRITPKKEGNFFLREFFAQYDKKTKNALREILMKAGLSKSEAKEQILLKIKPSLLEKNIVILSLEEIKEVIKGFTGKEKQSL